MTDKQLNKTPWSETKMKKYGLTPNRDYKGRKIIFEDEIISVLKKEYDDVPPNIGRDTWSSILSKKYIGISRRRMYDFLKQQPMYKMGLQRVTQSMAKSHLNLLRGCKLIQLIPQSSRQVFHIL